MHWAFVLLLVSLSAVLLGGLLTLLLGLFYAWQERKSRNVDHAWLAYKAELDRLRLKPLCVQVAGLWIAQVYTWRAIVGLRYAVENIGKKIAEEDRA